MVADLLRANSSSPEFARWAEKLCDGINSNADVLIDSHAFDTLAFRYGDRLVCVVLLFNALNKLEVEVQFGPTGKTLRQRFEFYPGSEEFVIPVVSWLLALPPHRSAN